MFLTRNEIFSIRLFQSQASQEAHALTSIVILAKLYWAKAPYAHLA